MLIGYMRVSKSDGTQTLDLQRDALFHAGVPAERLYEDLASGRKDARPGLDACLKALQPSNTLVIWKLDRLGRDLKHLVSLIDDLRRREVGLKVLAGAGAQIDTTTANGRLVFGIFAALAEFEAELIRERKSKLKVFVDLDFPCLLKICLWDIFVSLVSPMRCNSPGKLAVGAQPNGRK